MEPSAQLIHITPNAEEFLESAIRVCYNSFDKCDGTIECSRNLIKKIISNWHLDTLEHATATFSITCSRSAMAQITRHRVGSYGVESQRYVRYDSPLYIDIPHYTEGHNLYDEFIKISHETYQSLINDYGWKKEDARYVLPEAWLTNMTMTMDFRGWRSFLELRLEKSAQWEIRQLARSILKQLYIEAPSCFEDLAIKFNAGVVKSVESERN